MDADEQWTRTWGKDRITALCRDPQTLFVYWELGQWRRNLISSHFATPFARLALYLHVSDVTDIIFTGEHAHWDRYEAVATEADSAYIHHVAPDRVYVADLGILLSSGSFFTILRSHPVVTPPRFAPLQGSVPVRFGRLGDVSATAACHSTAVPSRRGGNVPYEETFDGYSVTERQGL